MTFERISQAQNPTCRRFIANATCATISCLISGVAKLIQSNGKTEALSGIVCAAIGTIAIHMGRTEKIYLVKTAVGLGVVETAFRFFWRGWDPVHGLGTTIAVGLGGMTHKKISDWMFQTFGFRTRARALPFATIVATIMTPILFPKNTAAPSICAASLISGIVVAAIDAIATFYQRQ